MRRVLLVAVMLMVACTRGGQVAVKTTIPTPVSTPIATPVSSPVPTSSPAESPAPVPGINSVTGSSRELPGISSPQASGGGGVIWAGEVNPADPKPINTTSSAGILPDQVTRFDVKSGAWTPWLYRPGVGLGVSGLDVHGHPLIEEVNKWMDIATNELLIAPDTRTEKTIYKGPLVGTFGASIADSHSVWFGSGQGIYLYSDANGLQKVAKQPGYPA